MSFSVVLPASALLPSFQEPLCDVDTCLGAGPGSVGSTWDMGPLLQSILGDAANGEGLCSLL